MRTTTVTRIFARRTHTRGTCIRTANRTSTFREMIRRTGLGWKSGKCLKSFLKSEGVRFEELGVWEWLVSCVLSAFAKYNGCIIYEGIINNLFLSITWQIQKWCHFFIINEKWKNEEAKQINKKFTYLWFPVKVCPSSCPKYRPS